MATLRRTRQLVVPVDHGWNLGMPAPSHNLARVAFRGERGRTRKMHESWAEISGLVSPVNAPIQAGDAGEVAILIFTDGRLESTLRVGTGADVAIGTIEWSPDGSKLFAILCRNPAHGSDCGWSLWEATPDGSDSRETPILCGDESARPCFGRELSLPVALSPDGRLATVSTALIRGLDDAQRGLWIVDLEDDKRPVRRVPFPSPR